jgi:hypothetical protein
MNANNFNSQQGQGGLNSQQQQLLLAAAMAGSNGNVNWAGIAQYLANNGNNSNQTQP